MFYKHPRIKQHLTLGRLCISLLKKKIHIITIIIIIITQEKLVAPNPPLSAFIQSECMQASKQHSSLCLCVSASIFNLACVVTLFLRFFFLKKKLNLKMEIVACAAAHRGARSARGWVGLGWDLGLGSSLSSLCGLCGMVWYGIIKPASECTVHF